MFSNVHAVGRIIVTEKPIPFLAFISCVFSLISNMDINLKILPKGTCLHYAAVVSFGWMNWKRSWKFASWQWIINILYSLFFNLHHFLILAAFFSVFCSSLGKENITIYEDRFPITSIFLVFGCRPFYHSLTTQGFSFFIDSCQCNQNIVLSVTFLAPFGGEFLLWKAQVH